jgi:hypothetical protein
MYVIVRCPSYVSIMEELDFKSVHLKIKDTR